MLRYFWLMLAGSYFLLAAALYSPSLGGPWQYDDYAQILDKKVLIGRSVGQLLGSVFRFTAWPDGWTGSRDLVRASFSLNWQWWELEPAGYRWENLIIHVVNAMLVAALVGLLLSRSKWEVGNVNLDRDVRGGKSKFAPRHPALHLSFRTSTGIDFSYWIAAFAGLLFLIHPIQSQAVAYVAQRFTSLATLFYLATAVLYTCYIRYKSYKYYLLAWLTALLAFTSKEITVTLPVALWLITFATRKQDEGKRKQVSRFFITFFLLPLPFFLLSLKVPLQVVSSNVRYATNSPAVRQVALESFALKQKATDLNRHDYFLTELNVVRTYLRLVVLPIGQTLDWDYPVTTGWDLPTVLSALLHLALIGSGVVLLRIGGKQVTRLQGQQESQNTGYQDNRLKGSKANGFQPGNLKPANLSSAVNLSGASSIAMIGLGILWFYLTLLVESSVIPITDVIYEHRVYLPLVGVVMAAAGAAQIAYKSYKSYKTYLVLAATLWLLGLSGATMRRAWVWGNEVRLWADVYAKAPGKPRANKNYGVVLAAAGQYERGVERLKQAVALEPENADYWSNYGTAYLRWGKFEDASSKFIRAYDLYLEDLGSSRKFPELPEDVASWLPEKRQQAAQYLNDYGVTMVQLNRGEEAKAALELALQVDPTLYAAHLGLGAARNLLGDFEGAIEIFARLTREQPEQADAWNNLSIVLTKAGRLPEALAAARQYQKLKPQDEQVARRIQALTAKLSTSGSR